MNELIWLIIGITLGYQLTKKWHGIATFFSDVDHQVYLGIASILALGIFGISGGLVGIFIAELEWLLLPSLFSGGLYIFILFLIFKSKGREVNQK